MSTCAYDNLADSTAMAQGYNSEGMHSCLSEGLQVCRRIGRLGCINCFREYAADVYLAADDLPLALHQAHLIASATGLRTERGDRRWLGARYQAWVMLLEGQLESAEQAARQSVELTEVPEVSLPLFARLRATPMLETVLLLSGQALPEDVQVADRPAEGEYPLSDLLAAEAVALAAACRDDHAAAITTLSRWDRQLVQRGCLHEWFEVRLRLTAAHLLAGKRSQAETLAAQLRTKAQQTRDWLTLRRLERLMDPEVPPAPVPLLLPLSTGPFAGSTPAVSVAVPAPPAEPRGETASYAEKAETPLGQVLSALQERVEAAAEDEQASLLNEVLGHPAASVTHPSDAAVLLSLAAQLLDVPGRGRAVWTWAEAFPARFPQHAGVLNMLAWLGFRLGATAETLNPGQGLEETLSPEAVDRLFRQSLDLDPNQVAHFARAGLFYLNIDNQGEAERCLARGFRLDRTSSFLAQRLAEVYQRTDRPRDALMVLDTCLREGGDDPELAWQAGMVALDLEQWDSLLTYLERYEEQLPGGPATAYYRAFGLLALDRPSEALALLDEKAPVPGSEYVEVLRACARAACGQTEAFRRFLEGLVVDLRLSQWTEVPRGEMVRLFGRLWKATDCLTADEPLRTQLADLLLETALAPDDLFEEVRQRVEKEEGVNFYRCVLHQPLDEHWPASRGCLPNEEDWQRYRALWGVLAPDEEEAGRLALEWQARCYPLAAEVLDVQVESEGYTDRPGVVWQGFREGDED
jgi:tetratricopeptide (TPR) repeat protein